LAKFTSTIYILVFDEIHFCLSLKKNSTPRRILCTQRSWHYWTFQSNISANLKPYSKLLYPADQGPRWSELIEKNRGQKSCDTVPSNQNWTFLDEFMTFCKILWWYELDWIIITVIAKKSLDNIPLNLCNDQNLSILDLFYLKIYVGKNCRKNSYKEKDL